MNTRYSLSQWCHNTSIKVYYKTIGKEKTSLICWLH